MNMETISVQTVTDSSVVNILSIVGPVGYAIIFILLGFSIMSWAVIFYKSRLLKSARKESQKFIELYNENSDLGEVYTATVAFRVAPVVRVFKAGYLDLQRIRKEIINLKSDRKMNNIEVMFSDWIEDFTSALQAALIREVTLLERFLILLAITSSTAPLLGLLGTVWGVIMSFWSVGMQGYSSLGAVAPGISAALTTTVAGLVTAIPAVIAYNSLLNQVKHLAAEMECFTSGFTSVVRRELRKAL
jgi:biopolymer transport protein TolQ